MKGMWVLAPALALLLAASPVWAAPSPSPTPATEKPIRTIAIIINGEPLDADAPPQVVEGRLLIPLRAVFGALGVPLGRVGNAISLRLPTGSVVVSVGSAVATVNGKSVDLDAPVSQIGATTYVPLKLLTAALGAQAVYDQRGARVEIVSAYIGRNTGTEQARADGGTNVQGVVSAVDSNSSPPSITVNQGGQARTIAITSDAKIYVEDATIHSQVKGKLEEVHVGDALLAVLTREGRVVEVHDYFKSSSGMVQAVSPAAVVLASGKVIAPGKATEITLNGATARLGDLQVGDFLTVRSNPESGELRQIVATRSITSTPTSPPSPSDIKIASFTTSVTRPLRAGESFDVEMHGTPSGRATFDIGDYLTGLELKEAAAGVYRGTFSIPDRFNVTQIPIYGHLSVAGASAPRAEASGTLSAATTAPVISEVAPPAGQTVNNSRPSIYATFAAPTEIAINQSSISIVVNGHDVTSSSTRTNTFVTYSPGIEYPDGEVRVTVKVADAAGNTATKTWSFFIKTR